MISRFANLFIIHSNYKLLNEIFISNLTIVHHLNEMTQYLSFFLLDSSVLWAMQQMLASVFTFIINQI